MKIRKKSLLAALAVSAILLSAGCTTSGGEYPVTLASYTFNEQPDSVICLNDSVADIFIACGYEQKITARSDSCTQEELSDVHSVGSASKPNVDEIKKLNPDVVFADKTLSEDVRTQLKNANINVLTIVPATSTEELSVLYGNICAVLDGNETGRSKGQSKAENLSLTMDDLQRIVPESEVMPTACYLYDINGKAASNETLGGKLFSYANVINVCSESMTPQETLESIRLQNPQYIFCDKGVKEKIESSEYFKNFTAVKNRHVYELPSEYISRQGNSLTEALSFIIETVYPSIKNQNSDTSLQESTAPESTSENSTAVQADTSLKITDEMAVSIYETSDNVSAIQRRLAYLGYFDEDITGYYGSLTGASILAFKERNNISTGADSISSEELRLMFSEKAVPAESFTPQETSTEE